MPRIAAKFLSAAAAIPLAVAILAVPAAAHADYYRGGGYGGYRGGYGGGHYGHRGIGPGAIVGGAILGLGVGALLARPYYAPPPVVYAPPPVYYAPPPAYGYAPAPAYGYAPPPPAYYPAPAYYR